MAQPPGQISDVPAPRQGAGGFATATPAALPQANFQRDSGAVRLFNYIFKDHKPMLPLRHSLSFKQLYEVIFFMANSQLSSLSITAVT